ncbi:MAG: sigma-70 family RNA polymerase sigma factor [Phycisphaerales bacterium]|nr:MAG: sigma-70 family RNA polymerase sigma factor [Phycisphaerales bacterium]
MRSRTEKLLELLDRSGASLFALLTRLTLHEDVAEELMQELFIKLNGASGLDKVGNWEAYARATAINLAFDWRRRNGRRPAPERLRCRPGSDDGPVGRLIRTEELQEMLNAVGRLNGVCREVLVMRYIQEESYDDIAARLDRTTHQVRGLCAKAMGQLRDALVSRGGQSE